jgi:Mg-chelatase subunit ChlD
MPDWIRRSFTAAGLTQIPPGPHLHPLQSRFGGGTVMLCIDVSGSMYGMPLQEAVRGAHQFVSEAIEAHYEVGVILWNTDVVGLAEPTSDGTPAHELLALAQAGGGNSLLPPLQRCHQILDNYKGDRVVAIFGDGDITPRAQVLDKVAQMKAQNIRFITRGLGPAAAQEFATVSSEEPSDVEVPQVEDLAASIAGMAASLRRGSGS